MRPCYFVVTKGIAGEVPSKYWDELPRAPIRNLVYVVRLDLLPNGEDMCRAPLVDLFAAVYRHLKKRGKLPPRWEPPPRPKQEAGTKVRVGNREVHPRRYLPDAP